MGYFFLGLVLLFLGCNDAAVQQELEVAKQELTKAQQQIDSLTQLVEPEGDLVHVVYFKLKSDVDQSAFIAEVKKMATIDGVMDLEIGPFEDLGDARALSAYSMMMQMSFVDKAAYEAYQQHPTHLALKENTQAMMAGPPATYDFFKK
ncbi:MAG: Dabb family protein [Bacteroidota bacterium]